MLTEKLYLYADRTDVSLTVYLWEDSPELAAGARRPLVLVCPGGAYIHLSDREAEPVALRFMAMGYHAAVLRYSVHSDPAALESDGRVDPRSLYPNQLRELGMAMLALNARAETWHIDPARIALCGFSAGAHNCALYAVNWNRPIIHEALSADPADLRPAAAILCYPVVDFTMVDGVRPEDAGLHDTMKLAFLGTTAADTSLLDEVNPAKHVDADTPPMFIWSTAADRSIPVQNSLSLAAALSAAGIPCELHIFETGAHGLSLADPSTAKTRENIDPHAAAWPALARDWLQRRFALEIPDV